MEQKRGWFLLSVISVLLVFCTVHSARRPNASEGAQGIEVCECRLQSNKNETDARFEEAVESMEANSRKAADAAHLKHLEATREVQL